MLLLEDPVHFYRNGRYYLYFYLDIPYGRGFGFSPQTIIQLDDYNTVDGCQVTLLKAHQNIVHETYQKAMVDMDKVDTPLTVLLEILTKMICTKLLWMVEKFTMHNTKVKNNQK